MFKKYMHLERFGNDEVLGIELGECYVFPKLDGTNASLWAGEDGGVQAGSRNRKLALDSDNHGFANSCTRDPLLIKFFQENPGKRLFGEWLVPHTLKTYRDDAWRKFYVFDVYDDTCDTYLPYTDYKPMLEEHGLNYVPAYAIMRNAQFDHLLQELQNNTFLMKEGIGEGIVIKNYDFKNKYGRTTWAKIVTASFKEAHVMAMQPGTKIFSDLVEEKMVSEFLQKDIVDKVYAKIVNEEGGWNSKFIPRLLSTVYHDFVTEELWQAVKKHKNPTVNFKTLNNLAVSRTKEFLPHIF